MSADSFDYDQSDVSQRYDRARRLDGRMLGLWMQTITNRISPAGVVRILDVGCGTGRFTEPLARAYEATVVGVDPSHKMLLACPSGGTATYARARADQLPLRAGWGDLVFMSMVWHHLPDKSRAAAELHRVQKPGGHLFIRNSTRDSIDRYFYMRFFPAARKRMEGKLPLRSDLVRDVEQQGYSLIDQGIIHHPRDGSPADYAERIAQRALSDLVALSDSDFEEGLAALRAHCAKDTTPRGLGEDVEFFVFRRN